MRAESLDVANRVVTRVREPEEPLDEPSDGPQSVSLGISKALDAATVELLRRAWARSDPFASVTLDVCGVGEKGLTLAVRIEMRGVSVKSCSVDAAASSENVTLQFRSVVFSYAPVDSKGQKAYSCTCQVGVNKSKSS
jgi:type VI protein secretion system component Hcp